VLYFTALNTVSCIVAGLFLLMNCQKNRKYRLSVYTCDCYTLDEPSVTAPTVTATPADATTATVTSETETGTDTGATICDDEKHTISLSDTIPPYRQKCKIEYYSFRSLAVDRLKLCS